MPGTPKINQYFHGIRFDLVINFFKRTTNNLPNSSHSPFVTKLLKSPPISSWSCKSSYELEKKREILNFGQFQSKCVNNIQLKALETYLETIVCPTSKFHFTSLIIEGKPCDIDLTCRLKYSCLNWMRISKLNNKRNNQLRNKSKSD